MKLITFLAVILFTASTAFAQASNKSEEVSRETKQEIQSILSDIQNRGPSTVVQPPALVVQVPAVPWTPWLMWQTWLVFSVALVLFGVLGRIVAGSLTISRPFKLVSGGTLLLLLLSVAIILSSPLRDSGPPSSAETIPARAADASLGFRFSVGDRLVNVNNDVEIGVVVRTEMAHTFRNGRVGGAYLIARPDGAEMDMKADVLERIAAKR